MAIVYYWDIGNWHKLATYDKDTASKVVHDPLIYRILETAEMCAVDLSTGEILAHNNIKDMPSA